jgi:hypothetical protein
VIYAAQPGTLELARQDAKLSDTSGRLEGQGEIPTRRSETVPFYAPACLAVHSRAWQAPRTACR